MSHLDPIEIDGLKFDKGSILFEFSALREPERTRFPQIGEWVKARCPMNEIPTPQMYWQGRYWPDLFIANQLDAVPRYDWLPSDHVPPPKSEWGDELSLDIASVTLQGLPFHQTFIEPMCQKITGRSSHDICAKFHRSLWLPLYWPQTLREGASIRTPFHYPNAGYAGAVDAAGSAADVQRGAQAAGGFDASPITLTFLLARPRHEFSVLFVVDPSPIYRITDMDVCAGIDAEWHRWILEGSAPNSGMSYGWAEETRGIGTKVINLPLPTIANVRNGWKPAPTINDKIFAHMEATRAA